MNVYVRIVNIVHYRLMDFLDAQGISIDPTITINLCVQRHETQNACAAKKEDILKVKS
jgi:hypothetical protein